MTDSTHDLIDDWETIGQFHVSTTSMPPSTASDDVMSLRSGISEALSLEVRQLEELRERNATLENANADLTREKEEVTSQKDALQLEVTRLHEMLGMRAQELDACCERYDALEDQHAKLTQSKDVLDQEVRALRAEATRLNEAVKVNVNVVQDKETLAAEKKALEEQLVQERNATKLRCEGLPDDTADLLRTRFQLGTSQETVRRLTEQINSLSEHVKATNEALDRTHKRYSALQSQNIKLAQEKEALLYEKHGQSDIGSAKDLSITKQALEDSHERCKGLKRSNDALTGENARIVAERDAAEKKVAELEKDVKRRDEYMNVIRVRSAAIQKSEGERRLLNEQVRLLTDELKSARSECDSARKTCVSLAKTNADLGRENKELRAKAVSWEGEKCRLEERVDRWKRNYVSVHQKTG